LKPARTNSSWDPILKIPITKKGWWSGSWCRPWFQTPEPKKKELKASLNYIETLPQKPKANIDFFFFFFFFWQYWGLKSGPHTC
jgi:hypothetical protein